MEESVGSLPPRLTIILAKNLWFLPVHDGVAALVEKLDSHAEPRGFEALRD